MPILHSTRLTQLAGPLLLVLLLAACSKTDTPPSEVPPDAEAPAANPEAQNHPERDSPEPDNAERQIDSDGLLKHVQVLASDAFAGRAPMSEGEVRTLDYLENAFREAGLAPLFGDSYRQAVDLVSIAARPDSARLTLTHDGDNRELAYGEEIMAWTLRVVPQVDVTDSELVFVGYGIVAPEYDWDDYAGVDVSGKTVVILVNDPGFTTKDPALFRGNAMTYYGRWTYKYEEAARQGAAAAIVVHEPEPAAYGWGVVSSSWAGPQFHLASPNDNRHRVAVEAWVQRTVAEEIARLSGYDFDQLKAAALQPDFQPLPLTSSLSAHLDNNLQRAQSFNIGGLIQGRSKADEVFIYTAHWDHLGTIESDDPTQDVIYNGAVDNATGTAGLIELAEAFHALPEAPQRSVAFLAVTAEESGLLGSAAYCENPAFPMPKTVAGVNIDSMHVYGPTKDVSVIGYDSSELEDMLRRHAAAQQRTIKQEDHPERGYYYRSDHFNFAKKGVPMLYAESGSEHRERGPEYLKIKGTEYLTKHYHSVSDEVYDDWDLRGAIEDLQLYYRIGLEVADGDQWPAWYSGNEFRAIREASLAR